MDDSKHNQAKADAAHQNEIDRLHGMITALQKANKIKRVYIDNANALVGKLLKEGRITKDEIKIYFPKKREVKSKYTPDLCECGNLVDESNPYCIKHQLCTGCNKLTHKERKQNRRNKKNKK